MNEALLSALDRLLGQGNVSAQSFDAICRDLMQPTLLDLEAFHDAETGVLHRAHGYLDEYQGGGEGIDGPSALRHVSDYLQAEAKAFGAVALKFREFEERAAELGYLDSTHGDFFLAVLHYLRLIQLDDVAYRVAEELGDMERLRADAIVLHVRGIIDNDFYALDHGLEDVRQAYAAALLQEPPES
jgi:hypothetical protein